MALYAFKNLITFFFPLPFTAPIVTRLILYISADHFVLQCSDTLGWFVWPLKIIPEISYARVVWDLV